MNDKKSSDVAASNKKSKHKATECYADEGCHEKSRKAVERASAQLVKDLKGGVEKARAACEKLKEDSARTEAMHEVLVGNLKDELCRVARNCEDYRYLEAKGTMKT